MTPTMLASDLACPDTLPGGEARRNASSVVAPTHPQQHIRTIPGWFLPRSSLTKTLPADLPPEIPQTPYSTWQTNPHSVRQAAYYK